jgi:hypothetical protein
LTFRIGFPKLCESRVESKKKHRGGETTERMNQQSLV